MTLRKQLNDIVYLTTIIDSLIEAANETERIINDCKQYDELQSLAEKNKVSLGKIVEVKEKSILNLSLKIYELNEELRAKGYIK